MGLSFTSLTSSVCLGTAETRAINLHLCKIKLILEDCCSLVESVTVGHDEQV